MADLKKETAGRGKIRFWALAILIVVVGAVVGYIGLPALIRSAIQDEIATLERSDDVAERSVVSYEDAALRAETAALNAKSVAAQAGVLAEEASAAASEALELAGMSAWIAEELVQRLDDLELQTMDADADNRQADREIQRALNDISSSPRVVETVRIPTIIEVRAPGSTPEWVAQEEPWSEPVEEMTALLEVEVELHYWVLPVAHRLPPDEPSAVMIAADLNLDDCYRVTDMGAIAWSRKARGSVADQSLFEQGEAVLEQSSIAGAPDSESSSFLFGGCDAPLCWQVEGMFGQLGFSRSEPGLLETVDAAGVAIPSHHHLTEAATADWCYYPERAGLLTIEVARQNSRERAARSEHMLRALLDNSQIEQLSGAKRVKAIQTLERVVAEDPEEGILYYGVLVVIRDYARW